MDSKAILGQGRFLRLVSQDGWEFVERPGVTAIVAILAEVDDHLVLIEQFRPPVGRRVVELPAGLAGDVAGSEGETVESAAQRELEEETGFEARRFSYLTRGPASAGASAEVITFLRAHGVHKVSAGGGDGSEDIQVHLVPATGVDAWLSAREREGLMIDSKVYTGLYFWLRDRARQA